jgi:M6 family metalloprotease-like protein
MLVRIVGKIVLVTMLAGLSAAPLLRADITSASGGDELPRAYYLRRERDPQAFTFRRAYVQQAERIRAARSTLMTRVAAMSANDGMKEVMANAASIAVQGQRTVPVLPVLYKNTTTKPFQESALESRLFGSQGNTMKSFYQENSYGLLQVSGHVQAWQQLPNADTFYEGADFTENAQTFRCNGMCPGSKLPDLIKGALAAADASLDFRQLDNDGPDGIPNSGDDDGFADFVAFVQPERGGECGAPAGSPPNRNIWSHRWTLTSWNTTEFETGDVGASGAKIKVDDYVIMPALNCDNQTMIHIGVFAHEFGHAFGLPDLYDTVPANGASQGIGIWCLMASGSWGGDNNSPDLPSHMSAWSKVFLGWLQPELVTATRTFNLAPVQSGRTVALKIPISSSQYYLVEYRKKDGFDARLPFAGVLVWKINDTVVNAGLRTNRVNGDAANKGVDLVEADGLNQLDLPSNKGGNRGDEGDPYPGSKNRTKLDITTNPKVQGNLSLCGIGVPGATVSLKVQTGQTTCG